MKLGAALKAFPIVAVGVCALAHAQKASDSTKRAIGQYLAHPLFSEYYSCSEHAAGELPYLGDDLGQDCTVGEFVDKDGRAFIRTYATDGLRNEDWYGWNKEVLSPCDCEVVHVSVNPITNEPGRTGRPPASSIELKSPDGTHVVIAHIQALAVKVGDQIKAGTPIARVGNNGFSRIPHIHIGAWRGNDALQIRWDQKQIVVH
jgi:peptidase M23-like protein